MKITIKPLLYSLALIALIAFGFQLVGYFTYKGKQNDIALSKAQATTLALKNNVENLLENIEAAGQTLGASFGNTEFSKEEIMEEIKKASLDFPEIRGVTACYEPDGFSKKTRLFCPYYDKGNQSYVFVEDAYDYTVKGSGTAWYTGVIENGATWADPYYGAASGAWYVDYGVPFYYMSGPKRAKFAAWLVLVSKSEILRI